MRFMRMVLVLALTLGVAGVVLASPAAAQDGADYVGSQPPSGGSAVSGTGAQNNRVSNAPLPITGADIAMLVLIGGAAIAVGGVMTSATRKRRAVVSQQ